MGAETWWSFLIYSAASVSPESLSYMQRQVLLPSAADGQEALLVVPMLATGQPLLQCICNVELDLPFYFETQDT